MPVLADLQGWVERLKGNSPKHKTDQANRNERQRCFHFATSHRAIVPIEGVDRAYKQQDGGEISRQHGHNRSAAPLESKQKWSARSSVSHGVPEQRETAVHSATLVHGLCQQNNNT
jgi:hypothetical protein